ncbi:hypothetical protein BLA60_30980 [Actinophytocola xinjiangensis]|uniref:Indolepyruvate ferredoxin oxidoreductase n=1 Tax=Actinophytocola xinjiangensis TaxID=485602 RepID=A0A7Z0WHB2_9PSEU|nr:indolepyruvate ferredoxin oxidoreductase family protein [Actinophytocola xinjiangensis]OLF06687.1 hypothetical protein BLA60_30980 [Actinophytocola xinjiangensis]
MDEAYRLEHRYERPAGRVQLNGDQALVRLLLEQRRADRRAGLDTSGYVSGYRGSPLGGLDLELGRARAQLSAEDVHFEPGVNEDLAATAVLGTQQAPLLPGSRRDGVFALWYGKGPGVDRSGDALKHGNLAGVARHGGVLVVAGDDPAAKSSSLAHQSEPTLMAAGIPVVNPATLLDVLTLGRHAWAMSRASGCWVGLKVVTNLMDSFASVELPTGLDVRLPDTPLPDGDHVAWSKPALAMERSLVERRLPRVGEYWRLNGLDRVHRASAGDRIGIAAAGRTYLELREALDRLGVDEPARERLGLRLYRITLSWPLEPAGAREFADGLRDVLVVEEKQPLIEQQLARQLYGQADRPRLAGKLDTDGRPLVPATGELTAATLRPLLARWLATVAPGWTPPHSRAVPPPLRLLTPARQAGFCAGCPHNLSTTVPEGSVALGGIGCHGMAVGMPDRETLTLTQMGGEGATWIGMSPFVGERHVFQNLGDGTYFHSGLLAVRAAVAAGVNITYKVLANGAIAMTGGQPIEGESQDGAELVPGIVAQLRALGVGEVVVVNDGTHGYPRGALPREVAVVHRDRLAEVQERLRTVPGVTAVVYDQFCAAEARRLRKRDRLPTPASRVLINERVCEGCGDCNHVSSCIAVAPVETAHGRKRRVDQAACNLDLSCVKGYCPSFVTVTGGVPSVAAPADTPSIDTAALDRRIAALPAPPEPTGGADVLITGIGGTGVSTAGAVLGMAAHLDGRQVTVLNQTGLAQKNGPVSSHIRIRPDLPAHARQVGPADVLVAADPLTTADPAILALLSAERTQALVDLAVAPTTALATDPDLDLSAAPVVATIRDRAAHTVALPFKALAGAALGANVEATMLMLGHALQRGLLGVTPAALDRAIELNGVAVDTNRRALALGRLLATDPGALTGPPAEPDQPGAAEIAEDRAASLVAYQNSAYARRYRALVDATVAADPGDGALSRAVATYFFKVMAYKDEYEVARLYTDGVFAEQLRGEFTSHRRIAINLAPQRFFPRDRRTGRPRKVAIPGRLALPALRVLAALKVVRGGPLDLFGHTAHRRRERALVGEYERLITEILPSVTQDTYAIAVELASLPEHVRGYGDIKDATLTETRARGTALLATFHESSR